MTNTQYDYQLDAAFDRAVLDVLNRGDASICVPEEVLRRIRRAMHDNNVGLRYGVSFPREESDEDREHEQLPTWEKGIRYAQALLCDDPTAPGYQK